MDGKLECKVGGVCLVSMTELDCGLWTVKLEIVNLANFTLGAWSS